MYQRTVVARADILRHGAMVDARARLVAERPEHDAAVIFVALKEPLCPVDIRLTPLGRRGEPRPAHPIPFALPIVAHAVGFDIRFVRQHYAVSVAKLREARIVRIMRGAYHIAVGALYEHDIPKHIIERDGVTRNGVRVVAVDAASLDGLSV